MFKKNFHLMFLSFTFTGTMIACTSSSWIFSWLGLELNLMSVIPLILFKLNFNSTESAIKYFIPQAMASLILIISTLSLTLKSIELSSFYINLFLILALAMKSGMAPLHFWFPQVMVFLEWNMCAVMLTWQKIAPFILLSFILFDNLTILLIVFSSITGMLGGINLLNIKLILTYSSIIHSSWMLTSLSWSLNLWTIYFVSYTFMSLSIIFLSNYMNISMLLDLNKSKFYLYEKFFYAFNIFSLAGLPPFLGFTAKLMIIYYTLQWIPLTVILFLVLTSLVSLYYYLKLFYKLFLNLSLSELFLAPQKISQPSLILIPVLMNFTLPILMLLA